MADNLKKFLDQSGVSTLWGEVAKNLAAEKARAEAAEAAALKAGQDAQADVDALEILVGSLPSGTTAKNIVEYVDKKTEGIATDSALAELGAVVGGHTQDIATLKADATTEGSVAYTATQIAAAKVAEIVANADANYDTLKEIADWILNDTTGAVDMANDIAALQAQMAGIDSTVVAKIAAELTAALKVDGVDKYALAADLTGLAAQVRTLETSNFQNGTQVNAAIDAKITALKGENLWDEKGAASTAIAALKAEDLWDKKGYAKEYTDAREVVINGKISTAEGAAKSYADGLFAEIQPLTEGEILAAIAAVSAQ